MSDGLCDLSEIAKWEVVTDKYFVTHQCLFNQESGAIWNVNLENDQTLCGIPNWT